MKISYDDLPPHMREGTRLYIEEGIEPGGFLYSVLSNDFKGALSSADSVNEHSLKVWLYWLTMECPSAAQGSYRHVDTWIGHRGLKGIALA